MVVMMVMVMEVVAIRQILRAVVKHAGLRGLCGAGKSGEA
jgi:hypothetical protein